MSGGAENGGAAEVFDEASETAKDGMEKAGRERLCFIQNDDGAGYSMELAAGGCAVGKKGFKKLDVSGDNNRRVPVFTGETLEVLLVVFRAGLGFELRVVFENNLTTEFLG